MKKYFIIHFGQVTQFIPGKGLKAVTQDDYLSNFRPGEDETVWEDDDVQLAVERIRSGIRKANQPPPAPQPVIDPNEIPQSFADDATYLKFIDAHPDLSVRIKAKKAYESTRK